LKNKKILLVEDNEKIMTGNVRKLTRAGYEASCALTLEDARFLVSRTNPDVIVLDILMPDGNGLEFMQELRQSDNAAIPILLLSGLASKDDIVEGLKCGGDDYLTKPYDLSELLARIEALIRRSERLPEIMNKGRLSIDLTSGIAKYDGKSLLLTKKEYALLMLFIQNEERFIRAEHLYEKVWNAPMESDNNALRSAIKRLRMKIEGCGWSISWSRGEGYIFEKV